jgi:hypothetical protein
VDFASKADSLGTDQATVRQVITSELPSLLGDGSLVKFVLAAFEQTKRDPLASLATRIEVAKALVMTKTASVSDAASLIVDGGLSGRGVTVTTCRDALKTLKSFGDEPGNATAKWISIVMKRFPLMKDFN